ncbi:MAG: amidohydrolase family protein [Candidatus Sumerlaeia bacterium]|nr:amidohydrolase family protein [Candidatus Sumerlaeia bacterium]
MPLFRLVVLCLFPLLLAACATSRSSVDVPAEPDVLIAGGRVIDGTGAPGVVADVVVHGGRIVHVGDTSRLNLRPARRIEASGLVVTPGFVDTHAHGEPTGDAGARNFLAQGVTTICLGMDGGSPARGSMRAWMDRVDAARPEVNVAPFVGHGSVRQESGTAYASDPTPEQIASMAALVRQAMLDGCWGMTTGLEYIPGTFATAAELVGTALPVAEFGGIVMSHMRSEDDDAVEAAIDELVAQGRGANVPVHVSHLKVVYGKGPARAEEILAHIEHARRSGVTITADVYPYTASYTGIAIVFPEWALAPNDWSQVKRERRAELQEYIRRRVTMRNGPEATLFGSEPWTGMTLKQVADEMGVPFEDVLIDRIGPLGASAAYFVMDEPLQARLLADPNVMVCSDGSATGNHPRGHGAFARVLNQYVNRTGMLPLEEAVRKMTGLPAQTIGLDRHAEPRGLLRPGFAADILVFHPDHVVDKATFAEPHQLAEGVDTILVNGVVARQDGTWTDAAAGRVLRKR